MFKSLKNKLLGIFTIYIFIGILLIGVNIQFEQKKQTYESLAKECYKIQYLQSLSNNKINNFLIHSLKDDKFYETKTSNGFEDFDSIFAILQSKIELLKTKNYHSNIEIEKELEIIANEEKRFKKNINEIYELSLKRGYKEFGIIGEMRLYAHKLENETNFSRYKLLTLRRHEKDFLLRNEAKYSSLFVKKAMESLRLLAAQSTDSSFSYLTNYYLHFKELVAITNKLGIKNNSGLIAELQKNNLNLSASFEVLIEKSNKNKRKSVRQITILYIVLVLLILISGLCLGFIFANKVSKPISILSKRISAFVESDFTEKQNFHYKTSDTEITNLITNYHLLKREIIILIEDFKAKVEERTSEIMFQKKKIEFQKNEVENIAKNLIASVNYASKIQHALLPSPAYLSEILPESFVYFAPRDIVSGDFYWVKKIETKTKDITIIAISDCTGHGVPGAFMSMLGISFLNEIITRKKINNAAKILEMLQGKVLQHLQKSTNSNTVNDGMDIAICVVDNHTKKIHFSGAKQNLLVVKQESVEVIKGSKMPIGKYQITENYTNHEINFTPNETFYISTDGYTDQFGGENDRKFSSRKLKELIAGFQNFPMVKQKEIIEKTINNWKKNTEQTDDILVFGFKPGVKKRP